MNSHDSNGDVVGRREHWKPFIERNPGFVAAQPKLQELANSVMLRTFKASALDRAIYGCAELAFDTFSEILILAGNGHGFGGRGLLRTMFERVVVSGYLHQHPEAFDDFVDFYWITQWKHINAVHSTMPGSVNEQELAKAKAKRDSVKHRFKAIECDACGTTGPVSWSKLDMVAMAKSLNMGHLLFECYYEPTQQVHQSVHSMMNHMTLAGDDVKYAAFSPQAADAALRNAHRLMLQALAFQIAHFQLDHLREEWQHCADDCNAAWKAFEQ